MRRPLTAIEISTLSDFYTARGATGTQDLIGLMLTTPEFLYHLENQGATINGAASLLRLSGYEIASKISYHYWLSMPNSELMAAAASGQLGTSDGIKTVIETVIFGTQQARTRVTVSSYFNDWLKIDSVLDLQNMNPAFLAFSAGENLNVAGHNHRIDMINEANDLVNYHVWDTNGNLSDLLTSNISFAKTDDLAHLYGGITKYVPGGPLVRFPAGERSGILTRSTLLTTGIVDTNPILKGVGIMANIVCNPLPSPPADLLDLRTVTIMGYHTTRKRAEIVMSNSLCTRCHGIINPIGFAFEAYDSLGRLRNPPRQNIYNTDGTIAATLPTSSTADAQIISGYPVHVNNTVDLSLQIAQSDRADACFARKYYEFTNKNMEDDGKDSCALQAIYAKLQSPAGGGMREMFKEIATQPSFLIRQVGP